MRRAHILLVVIALLASIHSIHAEAPEPGTGFATAPLLEEGVYDYHLAAGEAHFFRVWLKTGQSLHVILRVPMGQDFDLYLLSPERDLLEQSIRLGGQTERVSYQASYPGFYYILVYSYGESSGLYTLRIRIIDQPTKTITVTQVETVYLTETVSSPILRIETVTRTFYVTRTEVNTLYVERFPWVFAGLIALGVLIMLGLILMGRIVRLRESGQAPSEIT